MILGIAFFILSSLAKALMDLSAEGNLDGWGDWFDKDKSWRNKYKNGDPKQGEKFFGSTTFLVWLTDGWHLFQTVFYVTFVFSILIVHDNHTFFITLIFYLIGWLMMFELFYRIIKLLIKMDANTRFRDEKQV